MKKIPEFHDTRSGGNDAVRKMPVALTVEAVIVTARRTACLERCLDHLARQQDVLITVVVNGYDTATVAMLDAKARAGAALRQIVLDQEVPKNAARNAGLSSATGDIVYFLDDDAFPSDGVVGLLQKIFGEAPDIQVIGGPNVTPEGSSFLPRLFGHLLSSPFVSWRMHRRYAPDGLHADCDDRSLILCNLAIRRSVLAAEKISFDARLDYNEENLMLQHLRRRGYRMLYHPALLVYHARRSGVGGFARQVFKSGEGRGVMTLLLPSSFSPVHALPSLFVGYCVMLLFVRSVWFALPLGIYGLASAVNAVALMIRHKENPVSFIPLMLLPFVAHGAYGTGFVYGLWKRMKPRR
jgi:GT2 family glycosyltransferase